MMIRIRRILAGAVAVCMLGTVTACSGGSGDGYERQNGFVFRKNTYYSIYTDDSGETMGVYLNEKPIFNFRNDDETVDRYQFGIRMYFTYDNDLYCVKDGKPAIAATDVQKIITAGNGAVYQLDDSIYMVDANGRHTELDDADADSTFAISPDGMQVAFTEDGIVELNGKEIGDGTVLSLADDGTMFIDYNGKLLVSKKGEKIDSDELSDEAPDISDHLCVFTFDKKSILFYTGSKMMVMDANGNCTKLSSNRVLPKSSVGGGYSADFRNFVGVEFSGSDLSNTYRRYILKGDEYENFKIAKSEDGRLSMDARTLMYSTDKGVYVVSTEKEDADSQRIARADVDFDSIYYNENMTKFAYKTDDGIKVAYRNSDTDEECDEDVYIECILGNAVIAYSHDDGCLGVIEKGEFVSKLDIDLIASGKCGTGEMYYVSSGDEVYMTTDGSNYTRLSTDFEIDAT